MAQLLPADPSALDRITVFRGGAGRVGCGRGRRLGGLENVAY
ncbi:hypothetical protein [Hymenobacter volaticus]|nr:hypothetical protein [Hymenobacter volaticus]